MHENVSTVQCLSVSNDLLVMLYKSRLCVGTGRHDIVLASTSGRVTAEGDITAGGRSVPKLGTTPCCSDAADATYTEILTALPPPPSKCQSPVSLFIEYIHVIAHSSGPDMLSLDEWSGTLRVAWYQCC